MRINKSIFLVLGILAAASLMATPSILSPALANSHYEEKYLRCNEYKAKNGPDNYGYYFEYKNYYYYCWDDDKNSNGGTNNNNGGY